MRTEMQMKYHAALQTKFLEVARSSDMIQKARREMLAAEFKDRKESIKKKILSGEYLSREEREFAVRFLSARAALPRVVKDRKGNIVQIIEGKMYLPSQPGWHVAGLRRPKTK